MAEFTTGEAVAIELPVARIPTRAAAFVLDLMLQAVLGTALFTGVLLLLGGNDSSPWSTTLTLVSLVTVLVGYPVAFETLLRGATPGKLALGLRVVRADGGPVDFRHALTRGLTGAIVDFWMLGLFGVIAVVSSICSPNARRVGDVLAGTVVVHIQQRLSVPALAVPPAWLTGWSAELDLTDLPEDLALAVRQYLTRINALTPAAQYELGGALVAAVCARLRVAPPAGYPPVQILGSVIAERQRRALPAPPPSWPLAFPPVSFAATR
ncbi:RDD family protein [Nocardia jinanensis]|uniref:Transporter n=1 Tax=Nocardia jinanensis TaxID=382504 RepID=A0A917VX39_9NOCA|nr:RDD family protein [Nocardia jinanensis]GGL25885.1 transporter [Nocardia jinanensis]